MDLICGKCRVRVTFKNLKNGNCHEEFDSIVAHCSNIYFNWDLHALDYLEYSEKPVNVINQTGSSYN